MSFAQHFFCLFFVCATLAQTTVNISENDWTTLKLFFSAAGCKSVFCTALQTNRACVWPVICNNVTGNVLQLQLNAYDLSGPLITEIAQLNSLQALVLSNNRFTSSIPSELAKLSSFATLDLSNNQFTGTVPAEFDRSTLRTVLLYGNLLTGVVPFFPRGQICSLQLAPDTNKFCCSKGDLQPCCSVEANCHCSVQPPCSGFAPIPSRCLLTNDNGPNYTLCTMTTTIGSQRKGWWDYVPLKMLAINYTVSFWAKAREPLNSMMVTGRAVSVYRGIVFYSVGWTNGFVGRGFALGTDGFDLYEHRLGSGGIVVGTQHESLDGWHYYTIVQIGGSSNVYIDGNPMQSLRDNSITNNTVAFDVCFGNPRLLWASGISANGFEGWISELRLANRSMIGGEAYRQRNNDSAWDFIYPMQGCSGENHTGTEIDQFGIQQAFLVCKEPLPTCGVVKEEFSIGEQAGCLCESDDGTRTCLVGEWSMNDTIVARPLTRWLLNDVNSSMALDSSGNGFHGKFVGIRGVDYNVSSSHTSLNGGYIDFGDLPEFNFGTRDFFITFSIRVEFRNGTVANVLSKISRCYDYGWDIYIFDYGGGPLLQFVYRWSSVPGDYVALSFQIDNGWHELSIHRRGINLSLYVDKVLRYGLDKIINFRDDDSHLLIGDGPCYKGYGLSTLNIANISVYVDSKQGPICSLNSAGYQLLSTVPRCSIVGFCSPSKQGRQCCGARDCSECNSYRTCSRNYSLTESKTTSLLSSSLTTTSTMTMSLSADNTSSTTSSISSSATTNSTSVAIDVGANSQVLPTVGWIGVVIGGVLCGLLVGISICMILRKRSTLSPSQTSLDEFHSVKNYDESSQLQSRYSAIPPKPDHPYVDASFISIAEANEEIGRAMEAESQNSAIHY